MEVCSSFSRAALWSLCTISTRMSFFADTTPFRSGGKQARHMHLNKLNKRRSVFVDFIISPRAVCGITEFSKKRSPGFWSVRALPRSPRKQYNALLIICFLPTQDYLFFCIHMQSHKALPRWLILFGIMLVILSYNKVLLSVLILLASSLWWAQMETGSEGITRCASSVVYRQ